MKEFTPIAELSHMPQTEEKILLGVRHVKQSVQSHQAKLLMLVVADYDLQSRKLSNHEVLEVALVRHELNV